MVDKEKAEALDRKLAQKGESRTEWFRNASRLGVGSVSTRAK